MSVMRLDGQSPVLGRIRMRVPPGLVAVVGRTEPSREAFLRLLRRGLMGLSGEGGAEPVRVVTRGRHSRSGAFLEDLVSLQLGVGLGEEPGEILRAAAWGLARLVGGVRIDEAVAGASRMAKGQEPVGSGEDDGVMPPRGDALDEAGDELARAERELRRLRADHAELAGEVEVATMEWLRERQDAETQLQAYRDRARELKARLNQLEQAGPDAPCPTCQRVLGSHYDDVANELREEWESVVQDGSWWKRRREQLDLKPEALREMEGRSLRLQAATERCAEHVEHVRARERDASPPRRRSDDPGGAGSSDGEVDLPDTIIDDPTARLVEAMRTLRGELVDGARERILSHAGRWLLGMSGGRLLGFSFDAEGESLRMEGAEGTIDEPSMVDSAAATTALRIGALLALLDVDPGASEVMLVGAPFDVMDEETRLRTVDRLAGLRPRIPQILLLTSGDVVDLGPEGFDAILALEAPALGRRGGAGTSVPGIGRVRIG